MKWKVPVTSDVTTHVIVLGDSALEAMENARRHIIKHYDGERKVFLEGVYTAGSARFGDPEQIEGQHGQKQEEGTL